MIYVELGDLDNALKQYEALQPVDKQGAGELHSAITAPANREDFAAKTGIDPRFIEPVIGQQISWAEIVRHVFKVREFDRSDTTVDANNRVQAGSSDAPYGFLLVESPILNQPVWLPIIHRDDFLLATTVFDEPSLVDALAGEVELLVTYAPKRVLPGGLSGSPVHVLHYILVPAGTLEKYYSLDDDRHMGSPAPEKLFRQFVYDGEIRVERVPNPLL
jgi:hypothetical protein